MIIHTRIINAGEQFLYTYFKPLAAICWPLTAQTKWVDPWLLLSNFRRKLSADFLRASILDSNEN